QRAVEIRIGVGIGGEVKYGVHPRAGAPRHLQVGKVAIDGFVVARIGDRTPVRQPEAVTIAAEPPEIASYASGRASQQHAPRLRHRALSPPYYGILGAR